MNNRSSYQVAEAIMRKYASSFYVAFGKIDREKFLDIAAVYAFCRYADDLADNSSYSKAITLQKFDDLENEVRSLYEGASQESNYRKYAWWVAFENAIKVRRIALQPLMDQIDGQRSDIHFRSIENKEDLIQYCKKVAGTVGLMLAPMLRGDGADERYESVCESLGIAMQITNILRDIGEDLRNRNRIYIPQSAMKKYGVTKNELEDLSGSVPIWSKWIIPHFYKGKVKDNVVALWEEMALLSEHYYNEFYRHLYMFSSEVLFPVTAAAVYYEAILDEVRKNNYNCFTKRCYTSAKTKADLKKRVLSQVEKYR